MSKRKGILFSLISIFLIFISIETCLRIYDLATGFFSQRFYPAKLVVDVGLKVSHPSWHHCRLPDFQTDRFTIDPDTGKNISCQINKDGFRDEDFEYHVDELRVFFLGDSYTEGYCIEQDRTIPELTEKFLQDSGFHGGRVRTYNFGIGSFSPLLCFRVLRHYIDRFHPHIVIYLMNWGDPFDDACFKYADHYVLDANGLPVRLKSLRRNLPRISPNAYLKINCYTYYFVSLAYEKIKGYFIKQTVRLKNSEAHGVQNWKEIRRCCAWYGIQPNANPEVLRRIYQEAFKVIRGMKQICQKHNAKFFVVYVPSPWEVSAQETPRYTYVSEFPEVLKGYMPKGYYESIGEKILSEIAEESDVQLLIPLDFLRKQALWQRLYFVNDSHLGPKGAEAYAVYLAEKIQNYLKIQ